MENNSELNLARQIVEKTGTSLFLTGKAGTGKTTFLHSLRDTSMKRMVVLAPTGVAAINARGATIHSFFQFDFSPFIPGQGFIGEGKRFISFSKIKRRIISSLDLLVIDEISMVRPDILDAIDDSLRRLRNSRKPFGGVQLLLIGDLRQLAPVVTPDEWAILSHHYASPYFFESRALKEAGFITLELTKVYRQSDRRFIDLLNAVRENKVTEKILDDLNSRYIGNFNPGDSEGYIRLTTHNHMADSINWRRLAELQEAPVEYQASVTGKFPEYSFPADFMLTLKRGARVMFIKNDTGTDRRFYNGMLGTVVDLAENTQAECHGLFRADTVEACLGNHYPQEPGSDFRQGDNRRLAFVCTGTGLCGAEPVPVAGGSCARQPDSPKCDNNGLQGQQFHRYAECASS